MDDEPKLENLRYIINHVFLPPRLPQEDEQTNGVYDKDFALCCLALRSLEHFISQLPEEQRKKHHCYVKMVQSFKDLNRAKPFESGDLLQKLQDMRSGDVLPLLIRKQNAGVIFRLAHDRVSVETFEASPGNKDVLACTGKLICTYPGPTASFPVERFKDTGLQAQLSSFLSQMNVDELDGSVAHSTKAGSEVKEIRDTAHPRYITDLLVGILESLNDGVPTEGVESIQKRISDDILWKDTLLPWRRSPVWLVLRVALQTTMLDGGAHTLYKNFVAFMTADVLQEALGKRLESELLYYMRHKMTRRAAKIGDSLFDSVQTRILEAASEMEKRLQQEWKAIQTQFGEGHARKGWAPNSLDLEASTKLSLPHATPYLQRIYAEAPEPYNRKEVTLPLGGLRPCQNIASLLQLSEAVATLLQEPYLETNLADFEASVARYSTTWAQEGLVDAIAQTMQNYFKAADSVYQHDPDAQSIMLLTLYELWVALDKATIEKLPLLKDYPPELSVAHSLKHLLIRRKEDLLHVQRIARYLTERESHGTRPSVFAPTTENSFSVQYFLQSPQLQNFKRRIDKQAPILRQKKREELQQKNERHRTLSARLSTTSHIDACSNGQKDSQFCERCRISRELSQLTIAVHEWPLPHDEHIAQALVFEGDPPPLFTFWREATFFLVRDDLSNPDEKIPGPVQVYTRVHVHLSRVDPSKNSHDSHVPRISLGSTTKGFNKSHYKSVTIPAKEEDICVNHGHTWKLFDRRHKAFFHETPSYSASYRCTHSLSEEGIYRSLSFALGTDHNDNNAVANQVLGSRDISPSEYVVFASLRAGGRTQWLNMSRELASDSLTLRTHEVYVLFAQSAFQVGDISFGEGSFEWHCDLESPRFRDGLLQTMENVFETVQGNWMELTTLRLLIVLAARILMVAPKLERALQLLQKVRLSTYEWLNTALAGLETYGSGDESVQTRLQVCDLAASCRLTFDLDLPVLRRLLRSPDNVTMLLRCQMAISDYRVAGWGNNLVLTALQRCSWRLALESESCLIEAASTSQDGVNGAVSKVWGSYNRGSAWKGLKGVPRQWIHCQTLASEDCESQLVHLNLLTGQLLVDGLAVGHLPSEITQHPTYLEIFGQQNFAIIPSGYRGSQYVTRKRVFGHQLLFSFRHGRVVIRSLKQGRTYELLPASIFSGDIPETFVQDNVFWLRIGAAGGNSPWIELRPRDNMWLSSLNNWAFHSNGAAPWTQARLQLKTRRIVDRQSTAFAMVYHRLQHFEDRDFVIVTEHPDYFRFKNQRNPLRMHVELPRFKLSFFVDEQSHLRSQNHNNCIVDLDQSIGTMTGLMTRLVLTETLRQVELPRLRRILIPIGDVVCLPTRTHVQIHVKHGQSQRLLYYDYLIDTELGCLVGNATLESRLYKIYLHALTSHCMPDPLTRQTGVGMALDELYSAGSLSFQALSSPAIALLQRLRQLTPPRTYYPAHLKGMYTIEWSDNLPLVAQHSAFEPRIHEIFSYAMDLMGFNGVVNNAKDVDQKSLLQEETIAWKHHQKLLCRARDFLPARYPSWPSTTREDSVHVPAVHKSDRSRNVHRSVAQTILHDNLEAFGDVKSLSGVRDTLRNWRFLHMPLAPSFSLTYSRKWLDPKEVLVKESWLVLCRLVSSVRDGTDKVAPLFGMLFCLSSLAFGNLQKNETDMLIYLVAIATIPQLSADACALSSDYDLDNGTERNREVTDLILKVEQALDLAKISTKDSDLVYTVPEHRSESGSKTQTVPAKAIASPGPGSAPSLIGITEVMANRRAAELSLSTFHPTPDQRRHFHPTDNHSMAVVDESELAGIVSDLKASPHPLRQDYGRGIEQSMQVNASDREARRQIASVTGQMLYSPHHLDAHELRNNVYHYRDEFQRILRLIEVALEPKATSDIMHYSGGTWPQVTLRVLLKAMSRSGGWYELDRQWQATLAKFGLALLRYQHARRLLVLMLRNRDGSRDEELSEALKVEQEMTIDDVIAHPAWLLIQVENDFLTRPIQIQVAREMFSPSSQKNTVLQLNMGEGKSSVITPMVAASLADGSKLVRVVVLKSLSHEMFQLMVQRVSGLLDRRVCYFPFTRQTTLSNSQLHRFSRLYEDCVKNGGILIVQPEHILSSKLLLVDRIIAGAGTTAQDNPERPTRGILSRCLKLQEWISIHARDILDESDELLHVRYQLIYTVGRRRPIEGHPYRWKSAQTVLGLVEKHIIALMETSPNRLTLKGRRLRPWSYSVIRFFNEDAQMDHALLSLIAREIINENPIHGLTTAHLDDSQRDSLFDFILSSTSSPDNMALDTIRDLLQEGHTWNIVLVLKGLLGHGLLLYVLRNKRWRVDYGLDLSRSELAVPYRAKDVPSARSEYGHPDMAILLTCLAYYYHGLTSEQVSTCFRRLVNRRNAPSLYHSWTELIPKNDLPSAIRSVRGINVDDAEQHATIVAPLFRYNKAMINFYLADTVFPSAAKEYPNKIPSSGWDLAEIRKNPTTGFSGTNDNRVLLPSMISQADPVGQGGTNALVLNFLLRSENEHYLCTGSSEGHSMSGQDLIQRIMRQHPPIRVLLDVGAQMLDMQNLDLVKYWLHLNARYESIEAAVFFNENDELTVLMKDGTVEPFVSSPYRQRMANCIVYLDDAHTRGTDLKLPRDSRAAVTLGPKVTKDRLVQGCMRMRQLGQGQSVMFLAPPETDTLIRRARGNGNTDAPIRVVDIIRWSMVETCNDLLHHAPHWAQQGLDYMSRQEAMAKIPKKPAMQDIAHLRETWLQKEARTLAELYDTSSQPNVLDTSSLPFPQLASRLRTLGFDKALPVNLDEEQEREVSHEVQVERDVERPPYPDACTPSLHVDLRRLVTEGIMERRSDAFLNAFATLGDLKYQKAHRDSALLKSRLLVTHTFANTVVGPSDAEFLKPVQWVLSPQTVESPSQFFLVILSQFEVNELLPDIRHSKHVRLHIYSAKTSVSAQSFDHLQFYCIPSPPAAAAQKFEPFLIEELNMFSGQLYPSNYEDYLALWDFLGLDVKGRRGDRFMGPRERERYGLTQSPFQISPVRFFKELLAVRRKGQEFDSTPVGRILNGQRMKASEF